MANTTGKKFGGRQKGVPNKTTDQLRGLFQSFVEANINDLQANFNQLEAKDKLNFVISLTKLILPPPLAELQKLSDEQLSELINRLKKQNNAI
jgi:hypothetical protein